MIICMIAIMDSKNSESLLSTFTSLITLTALSLGEYVGFGGSGHQNTCQHTILANYR